MGFFIGVTESFGYVGSFALSWISGTLIVKYGTNSLFNVLLIDCIVALFSISSCLYLEL